MKQRILIVEDDFDISNMIKDLLQQNGYEATAAYSGTEAVMCLEKYKFDLILLDLMLPGIPGEKVLAQVRKEHNLPVIAVSAKTDKMTRLSVLKEGADDYITKPFDNDELIVRIEVLLRRERESNSKSNEWLIYKDLKLNTETFEVIVGEQTISLTKREYLLLELLMNTPNKVFTKNNIYESVWNEEFLGEDNAVNVHISNIRNKLAKVNPHEKYIKTVWGIGFKME